MQKIKYCYCWRSLVSLLSIYLKRHGANITVFVVDIRNEKSSIGRSINLALSDEE